MLARRKKKKQEEEGGGKGGTGGKGEEEKAEEGGRGGRERKGEGEGEGEEEERAREKEEEEGREEGGELFVMLDGCSMVCPPSVPFELVTDGDLLVLIRRMIDLRGGDTVRILRLKGHADEGMVADGRVRMVDRLGNNAADEAADFGRRRVGPAVIDARRNLSGVCSRWYPCCS